MNKIKKVLVLGSAALKIGEAGEFDYSGSQAIKALKDEGIKSILVNPNIATIQTSEGLADKIYLLPINVPTIEGIIKKEAPDGILLTFGGQTALNCGLELNAKGILQEYKVAVLGTSIKTIETTEDRGIFKQALAEIGVKVPRSYTATNIKEVLAVAQDIKYPVMMRIGFALGGLGSGIFYDEESLAKAVRKAFSYTDQILVEECLKGWKEIEYEVVRDKYNNCITVCNMENFDPLGIHTGESIVVAPSQTLSNDEYFKLRAIAIETVQHLGVVGECNIQYALDPKSNDYRVIEVNSRLSRSSALASKATGYPLAYIATKLALGYALTDIDNSITKVTKACFEPSLDYVVIKIPRWDLRKFNLVSNKVGSSMKSVGEVMAIGRSFKEALQKALRMLDTGANGFVGNKTLQEKFTKENICSELENPTDERILVVSQALIMGMSIDEIYQSTFIDKWFLYQLEEIIALYLKLKTYKKNLCPTDLLIELKENGFSDQQIADALEITELKVRKYRQSQNIIPYVKQIDTLAGEYPAQTNYLYLTYNARENDIGFREKPSIIVLGSGCYRIGSSVEFDWSCVNAVKTIREAGYRSILINFNPETVSTDYDEVDRLYFDEISLETVMEIYRKEQSIGVVVSMGGQIANNLALPLMDAGVKVLGTSPEMIDKAEDRHKFSSMLDRLGIEQPPWSEVQSFEAICLFAEKIGYPVLVRPSYVLSGSAMGIATSRDELKRLMEETSLISPDHPVVVSKYLDEAREIEFDGVAKNGKILLHSVCEHIENAGVHSGDATLALPPQRLYVNTIKQVEKIAREIAKNLEITGPFNVQFLAKEDQIKVIECNLRASRTVPFVSKVMKVNFINLATKVILGMNVKAVRKNYLNLNYVGVKASQFSFIRLIGADPVLGVEMASTGEVGCLGDDFNEALLKALLSVGIKIHLKKILLSSGPPDKKHDLLAACRELVEMGVLIYATRGSHKFLEAHSVKSIPVLWPDEGKDNVLNLIEKEDLDLVINIPKSFQVSEINNDYRIRRRAVDHAIPLITNRKLAKRFIQALGQYKNSNIYQSNKFKILPWNEY